MCTIIHVALSILKSCKCSPNAETRQYMPQEIPSSFRSLGKKNKQTSQTETSMEIFFCSGHQKKKKKKQPKPLNEAIHQTTLSVQSLTVLSRDSLS